VKTPRRLAHRSLFVLLAASLAIACQTGPKVETTVEETPDGVVMVQTVRMQATVEAIDATNRTVRLRPRRGDVRTIKVAESARNFQNVRVGDEVHATYVEETAISLVRGGAPQSVGAGAAVKLAPEGGRPGIIVADSVQATATVVGIDAHEHSVTLEFMDGSVREINVSKKRDLSNVGLGDSVRVQMTDAVAIEVVKP
jgi:hypothetical protein